MSSFISKPPTLIKNNNKNIKIHFMNSETTNIIVKSTLGNLDTQFNLFTNTGGQIKEKKRLLSK